MAFILIITSYIKSTISFPQNKSQRNLHCITLILTVLISTSNDDLRTVLANVNITWDIIGIGLKIRIATYDHLCLSEYIPQQAHVQRNYSLSPGFWQSFISIEVFRDCISELASSCKKQLTGFFVCLLFFLNVKRIS